MEGETELLGLGCLRQDTSESSKASKASDAGIRYALQA